MAFCVECGAKLTEGAVFCADCGTKVGVSSETAVETETAEVPAPAWEEAEPDSEASSSDQDEKWEEAESASEAPAPDQDEDWEPPNSKKSSAKKAKKKAPDISPSGQFFTLTKILNQSVPYGFFGGNNDALKNKASEIIHSTWKQGEQAGTITVDEIMTTLDKKLGLTGLGSKTDFLNQFRSKLINAVAKGYLPLVTI
jgi:uncharacterized Zn finger protein (UPF0148 family)